VKTHHGQGEKVQICAFRPNGDALSGARSSAGVYVRTAISIRFGASDYLPRNGRHFADAEEQEAEQVGCGIALSPFEVDVRQTVRVVAYGQE
jgi:hypothetical protein